MLAAIKTLFLGQMMMSLRDGVKPLALSPLNNHAHQLEGECKRILDIVRKV